MLEEILVFWKIHFWEIHFAGKYPLEFFKGLGLIQVVSHLGLFKCFLTSLGSCCFKVTRLDRETNATAIKVTYLQRDIKAV